MDENEPLDTRVPVVPRVKGIQVHAYYVCKCVYFYMCIHTHTYTHTYIQIIINGDKALNARMIFDVISYTISMYSLSMNSFSAQIFETRICFTQTLTDLWYIHVHSTYIYVYRNNKMERKKFQK